MSKRDQKKFFAVLFCCAVGLSSFIFKPKPADKYDHVVAQDGSGDFKTVQQELMHPRPFLTNG